MKTNLKIWIIILVMVAAGGLITRFTTAYVSQLTARYAADSMGTEETAAVEEVPAEAAEEEDMAEPEDPDDDISAEETTQVGPVRARAITGPDGNASEDVADQAPEAASADAGTEDVQTRLADIREHLTQVEAQIERLRDADTDSNVYNVRNLAQSEQKIWERELDTVYDLLMETLPEDEAEMLKKEQQTWLEETTNKAREASGKVSGSSMESVEYAASVAESTRARVYSLLDTYE